MARFVEVISQTSGGAERRVKMPFAQFVTELGQEDTFPTSEDTGGTYEIAANSPADGDDVAFTFTLGTPVFVTKNGVIQQPGVDVTITSLTATFAVAPLEGAVIGGLI